MTPQPLRFVIEVYKNKRWKRLVGGFATRANAEMYGRRYCIAGCWRVIDLQQEVKT